MNVFFQNTQIWVGIFQQSATKKSWNHLNINYEVRIIAIVKEGAMDQGGSFALDFVVQTKNITLLS